jgi:hypothetical protein
MKIRTLFNKWSNYLLLIKYLNCALATVSGVQKASGDHDDEVLRSVNGLEGGCAACGSTCGVATGGSLGVGLMNEALLQQGLKGEMTLVETVRDFMDWFQETHGSSLCLDRTGVDFHTVSGQLFYLFPGNKVAGCITMAGRTLNHLVHDQAYMAPRTVVENISEEAGEIRHCARYVLEQIRMKTGLGNPRLERLAVVFDGGVGLKGEVCGACVGAMLAINLANEFDIGSAGIPGHVGRFVRGHLNLVRKVNRDKKEAFAMGKHLVTEFMDRFGTMQCSDLCGTSFGNSREFIDHISKSSHCCEIMDFAVDKVVQVLSVN